MFVTLVFRKTKMYCVFLVAKSFHKKIYTRKEDSIGSCTRKHSTRKHSTEKHDTRKAITKKIPQETMDSTREIKYHEKIKTFGLQKNRTTPCIRFWSTKHRWHFCWPMFFVPSFGSNFLYSLE